MKVSAFTSNAARYLWKLLPSFIISPAEDINSIPSFRI